MVWALLILLGVVIAIHWFEYRRNIQEYTFAQPKSSAEIRDIIGEKTPIVVEIGALPWRSKIAADAGWPVAVGDGVEIPVSEWLKAPVELQNGEALAESMGLATGLADINDGRQWWWMAGLQNLTVDLLEPGQALGLHWVGAERHWIGCSDGEPLTLWLVHSRYRKFLPASATGADPWALTVAEAPWIGRVQYIEVIVRPGWCVGVPAHWGVAARPVGAAEKSWVWTADQHSPLSFALENISA
jgi:hypothetical protein